MNLRKLICSLSILASLALGTFAYAEELPFEYDITVATTFLPTLPKHSFRLVPGTVKTTRGTLQFVFFTEIITNQGTKLSTLIVGVENKEIERIKIESGKVNAGGDWIEFETEFGEFRYNFSGNGTFTPNTTFDLLEKHWFR
jgi:hypothetical protein